MPTVRAAAANATDPGRLGEPKIASKSLYRPGVGDQHDDEWNEEGDERRVDSERPVKDPTRPRPVARQHQHMTCNAAVRHINKCKIHDQ